MPELISFPLRYTFREFCVGYISVRVIQNMFYGYGIEPVDISHEKREELGSSRRVTVEEYYAAIDWTSRQSVQGFLNVLNFVLGQSYGVDGEKYQDKLRELAIKDGLRVEGNTVSLNDMHGVKGNVKNLIFAAKGPKPEIVLIDSVNNDIQIVQNEKNCLVYDRPIPEGGFLWKNLVDWWHEQDGNQSLTGMNLERSLYNRLYDSMESEPEKLLFYAYFAQFRREFGDALLALIPQVYLHYDPYTIKQLSNGKRLTRQRMDFLLLFSNHIRIVLEVDGKQHYSEDGIAKPSLYAEMVTEDRRLRFAGYEIYRFGGYELQGEAGKQVAIKFFYALFERHALKK